MTKVIYSGGKINDFTVEPSDLIGIVSNGKKELFCHCTSEQVLTVINKDVICPIKSLTYENIQQFVNNKIKYRLHEVEQMTAFKNNTDAFQWLIK